MLNFDVFLSDLSGNRHLGLSALQTCLSALYSNNNADNSSPMEGR